MARENLIKECDEEASINKILSTKAIPVGAVSYIMESESGLKPDTLYCFDLELPLEFTHKNKDGEIIEIDRRNNRAKIKGINMVKKHLKTTKEKKGGIISKENYIHISNLIVFEDKKKKKEIKK